MPNLTDNIKNGNSLIGPDYFAGKMFPDSKQMKLINPFDWKRSFPDSLKTGGFDCVIGNPPYFSVDDTWGRGDLRLEALKTLFPEVYNDKTDILFYFLAKSAQLCKGRVSFIVSRAFLEAYKADRLRLFLADKAAINQIIDFRNFHVFSGIGITTCIITFEPKATAKAVQVYKLLATELPPGSLIDQLADSQVFEKIRVEQSTLGESAWSLVSSEATTLNDKIDRAGEPLGTILTVGQGMQTGCNEVFGRRTQEELDNWQISPTMFYKRASNSDIQRYFIRDRGEYILYVQSATTFGQLPAELRKHFSNHASELKRRAAYKRGDCEWWKFTWPLHEELYDRIRIVCPYLATSNRFAQDDRNEFLTLTDTTVLFENAQPENMFYILGVLNSRLLTFRFRHIGKLKGNDIYEYFENSVSKLPIRRIDFSSSEEKNAHERIVKLVESMLILRRRLAAIKSDAEKTIAERQIDATDAELDRLVYDLYGLTAEEIVIVEKATETGEQGLLVGRKEREPRAK